MGVLYRFWKRVLIHRDRIRVFLSVPLLEKLFNCFFPHSRACSYRRVVRSLQLHKSRSRQPRFNRCHATTIDIAVIQTKWPSSIIIIIMSKQKKRERLPKSKSIRKKGGRKGIPFRPKLVTLRMNAWGSIPRRGRVGTSFPSNSPTIYYVSGREGLLKTSVAFGDAR